jgi:hypothetical protein
MAEATNELIYEILEQLQSDVLDPREGQREQSAALNAIRSHLVGVQQDTQNIYATLVRHDERLDHIEQRLELSDAPAG